MKETLDNLVNDMTILVKKHFDPGELFGDKAIIEFVKHEFDPDQVFDETALKCWALNRGFIEGPHYED